MEKVIRFMDELDAELFSLRLILAGYRGLIFVPILSILTVTGLFRLSGWFGPGLALVGLCVYRAIQNRGPVPAEQSRRHEAVGETSSA